MLTDSETPMPRLALPSPTLVMRIFFLVFYRPGRTIRHAPETREWQLA